MKAGCQATTNNTRSRAPARRIPTSARLTRVSDIATSLPASRHPEVRLAHARIVEQPLALAARHDPPCLEHVAASRDPQRGLARPVGSHEGHDLVLADLEVHVPEHLDPPVAGPEPADLQHQ